MRPEDRFHPRYLTLAQQADQTLQDIQECLEEVLVNHDYRIPDATRLEPYFEYMHIFKYDILPTDYFKDTVLMDNYEGFLHFYHLTGSPDNVQDFVQVVQTFMGFIVHAAQNADGQKCGLSLMFKQDLHSKILLIVAYRVSFPPFALFPLLLIFVPVISVRL